MTTRDDIHKIKQALECACNNNSYLSSIATVTLRANWTTIVGNSIDYTYEPVTNNLLVAEYYTGTTLIFTQTYAYDANNNCISIVVS